MAKPPEVEFFYDCSSPWTYLGFTRIIPMMASLNLPIRFRPVLVGGIFNAVNQDLYSSRKAMLSAENSARLNYYIKDLSDWAKLCGLTIVSPRNHPISSVKAMRGAFFAEEQGLLLPYSQATFETYWGGENSDITNDDVLAGICVRVGLDAEGFFNAINNQQYKDLLRANTDEAIARGAYGSPSIFINGDDMYFGNDRLPLVEHRLRELLVGPSN
ncbi:MAG: 2-hydroxychromene-2-carboxylate isomerase [Bacteroidia bacterium]|jgi:2-hydroxychromene-2-carboxylate isomerase